MSALHHDVLIVGGGHAGAQAAIALRQRKFAGSIAIVGEEHDPPYERPPLSKEYFKGEKPFERLLIRPAAFWRARGIALVPGCTIVAIDAAARRARAHDGRTFAYGTLIWAAGGAARRLRCEGGDLDGVHTIRTRVDVDRLKAALPGVARAVIVGGGYIGLEAAAALVAAGKPAVLLEAQDRVLARVAGAPLSRFFQDEHAARGVDIRLNQSVVAIEGRAGRVAGVRLVDGTRIDCQLVIVGIGIESAIGPLARSGASAGDGVMVDDGCRTTVPGIFAIGDCALHANRYANGRAIRLESVQNAHDQAAVVASILTGTPASYDTVPWFWSSQYDVKLQTVGLSMGHDTWVTRGDPASRAFSVIYLRDGAVIALDCVNATRDYVQGKALVETGARIAPDHLSDPLRPLKDMRTTS